MPSINPYAASLKAVFTNCLWFFFGYQTIGSKSSEFHLYIFFSLCGNPDLTDFFVSFA